MSFLLDTNCISELVRLQPEPSVVAWFKKQQEVSLYLSVLTIGEIRKGLETLHRTKRKKGLESWLEELKIRFASRILAVEAAVAERWGVLSAQARSRGQALSVVDGLLAATALHYHLTIVTRNTQDFSHTGVQLVDPWQS